jgi:hypothetical protein
MWWDVVVDVLWPTRGPRVLERSADQIVEQSASGTLRVEWGVAGEFTRRLNDSGWLAEEVIAAGTLRQGRAPSLLALFTGTVLLQLVRGRPCKSLPREFVLAVTTGRVVAFAMSPWGEGDRSTDSTAAIRIKRGERGSWPCTSVRLAGLHKRVGVPGATLDLPGEEPFPVTWHHGPTSDELIDTLNKE